MKRKRSEIRDHFKTFHVFQGIGAPELKYTFQKAQRQFQKMNSNVSFIYLSTNQIEKEGWTIKDLIDWLQQFDFHIILSHIHQGKLHLIMHIN